MRGTSSLCTADLDRLAARVSELNLAEADRSLLDHLIRLGREAAAAREAAEAAGLVIGSAPVTGKLDSVPDAFRRAFAPGTRADIASLPPRG